MEYKYSLMHSKNILLHIKYVPSSPVLVIKIKRWIQQNSLPATSSLSGVKRESNKHQKVGNTRAISLCLTVIKPSLHISPGWGTKAPFILNRNLGLQCETTYPETLLICPARDKNGNRWCLYLVLSQFFPLPTPSSSHEAIPLLPLGLN